MVESVQTRTRRVAYFMTERALVQPPRPRAGRVMSAPNASSPVFEAVFSATFQGLAAIDPTLVYGETHDEICKTILDVTPNTSLEDVRLNTARRVRVAAEFDTYYELWDSVSDPSLKAVYQATTKLRVDQVLEKAPFTP